MTSALQQNPSRARAFPGISLVLPYPVSANRYWRTYMPRGFKAPVTVLSAEAKTYKAQASALALFAGISQPIPGRVEIHARLYPKRPQDWQKRARISPDAWGDTVQCLDLDNALKVTIDALKGIAFDDDDQVHRIIAERMDPDGDARIEIRITPITPGDNADAGR
jgi:crossover junction endodeoxyribonuclease RusA